MAVYFMYDVKQFVPEEWSSPPLDGRLVKKEGVGTVCMGRGAVNQKGPENSFLSALMAFQAAGRKLPVNLVLVCEGEEEIGSPHFHEVVQTPKVLAELKKCSGVFMPEAGQELDGGVQVNLGAKGVIELELIASGEKWGRGPAKDIHSSLEAQVDSPSWHLVQALNSLIEGRAHRRSRASSKAQPLTGAAGDGQGVCRQDAKRPSHEDFGVKHWVHDKNWLDSWCCWSQSRRSTSGDSWAATPAPAARRCCRTGRWPRLTCGWCRT
jgi:acetylornithine deacetylase/succinyl-diaminopimelate desuccinylase-like protein